MSRKPKLGEEKDNDEETCQIISLKRKDMDNGNANENSETEGLGNKRRKGNGFDKDDDYVQPIQILQKDGDEGNSAIMGYILPTERQKLTPEQRHNRVIVNKKWKNMKALKKAIIEDPKLRREVQMAHGEKILKAFDNFCAKDNIKVLKVSESVFLGDAFYEQYKTTISEVMQGQLVTTKSQVEVKIKELGNTFFKEKQKLEKLLWKINNLIGLNIKEFSEIFETNEFNFDFLKFVKECYLSTAEFRTVPLGPLKKNIDILPSLFVSNDALSVQFLDIKKEKQRRYLISPYKTNSDEPDLSLSNCSKLSYIILCSTQKEKKTGHLEFKWFMHHTNLRNFLGVPYLGIAPLDEEIWKDVKVTFNPSNQVPTSCTFQFILGPGSLKTKSLNIDIPTTVFEMQKLVKNKMNFVLLNGMIKSFNMAYLSDTINNKGFCEKFCLLPNCPDNYVFHVGRNGKWPGTMYQTSIGNLGKEEVMDCSNLDIVRKDCPSTSQKPKVLGYILPTEKQAKSLQTTGILTKNKLHLNDKAGIKQLYLGSPLIVNQRHTLSRNTSLLKNDNFDVSETTTFIEVEDGHVNKNNKIKKRPIVAKVHIDNNLADENRKKAEENRKKAEENRSLYLKCPIHNCSENHGSVKQEAEQILNVLTETHFKDHIDYILSIEQKQITDKRQCPVQPCGFVSPSRNDLIKHYGVIHQYSNSILKVSSKYDSQSEHKLSFYPKLKEELERKPRESAKTKHCEVCELKCDERYEEMHRAFYHKNEQLDHNEGEIEVDQNSFKQEVLFINAKDVKQESLEVDIKTEIATKESMEVQIKKEIEDTDDELNVQSDIIFEFDEIAKQQLLEIEIKSETEETLEENENSSSSLVDSSTSENKVTEYNVDQLLTIFFDNLEESKPEHKLRPSLATHCTFLLDKNVGLNIERATLVTQKKLRQDIFGQLILFLAQECESPETAFQVLTYLEEENVCIITSNNIKSGPRAMNLAIASTTLYRDFKNIFWIVLEYKKYCKSINQSITSCSSLNIIIWMNLIMKTYHIYPMKMILALQLVSRLHDGVPHENQSFLSFPPGCSASLFLLISKQWPLSNKTGKSTHRPLIHDDKIHKFLYHIASTQPDQPDKRNKSIEVIRKIQSYTKV